MEKSVTWIHKDLFVCKLDQEDIKDELGFIMGVPKKWKDKPAWFKLVDFFSLGVFPISCNAKQIRIRIWFS